MPKGQRSGLDQREYAYVQWRVKGLSPLQAAMKLGFSKPSAQSYSKRAEKRPTVIAAIAEEQKQYREAAKMTKEKVIEGLKEAIDVARTLSEPSTMVAGWREIGKLCGLYEPEKREIGFTPGAEALMNRLANLSDAELTRLAERTIEGEAVRVEEVLGLPG